MRKILSFFALLLVLVSCGSRKAQTGKQEEKLASQSQKIENVKIDSLARVKIVENVEISEKTEDVELILTKEYYPNGVLKIEKSETRKGKKQKNQNQNTQSDKENIKSEKQEIKLQKQEKKAVKSKEKATERQESQWWFWLPITGFLALIFYLWLKHGRRNLN